MKKFILAGLFLSLVSVLDSKVWAADPAPTNAAPVSSAPAPPAPASADAAWSELIGNFHTTSSDPASAQERAKKLETLSRDFVSNYPSDPHARVALQIWTFISNSMRRNNWPGAPTEAEEGQQFDRWAMDEKVPKETRASIRASQIASAIREAVLDGGKDPAKWDAVEKLFSNFDQQFGPGFVRAGGGSIVVGLRREELMMLKQASDSARYAALLKKLETDPHPGAAELAKEVEATDARMAELKTKPMDLKFTAIDGMPVDLAKLRGKVVLIDFWATWCGPCVGEVPNVVATYQKYHGQGFEVVGISLDEDKQKLLDFTQAKGMVWPQYFDGKVWKNDISSSFGINSIPAMWLIGKDGKLVTTNGREDLAGQVGKLLAAP